METEKASAHFLLYSLSYCSCHQSSHAQQSQKKVEVVYMLLTLHDYIYSNMFFEHIKPDEKCCRQFYHHAWGYVLCYLVQRSFTSSRMQEGRPSIKQFNIFTHVSYLHPIKLLYIYIYSIIGVPSSERANLRKNAHVVVATIFVVFRCQV